MWDYPRGLAIETSPDGESWQTVVSEGILPALAWSLVREARTPGVDVRLPSNASLAVRIRTTGQGSRFPWTINELWVWERPSVEP